MVRPFDVKNGPTNFQKVVSRTFKKYLYKFTNIFLDVFTIYNNLMKLKLCFQKCKKININIEKCAFMVF
jgi:hypothetical protein